jgi:hypothetical protein
VPIPTVQSPPTTSVAWPFSSSDALCSVPYDLDDFCERYASTRQARPRWRARHADCCLGVLSRIREHAHDPLAEVFWAVRLRAEQDNLLAAWSWAIDTGNVDTAFRMLAGLAPYDVWTSYPLLLNAEAALELPGATEHPDYPLALAVSAVFASNRADVTVTEELCRRAAEANAGRDAPDWHSNLALTTGAFADNARLDEQAAAKARTHDARLSRAPDPAGAAAIAESPNYVRPISLITEALGEEHARELRVVWARV